MKLPYYNLDRIDKENASINLIWGERANGKSYQVKHKKGILPFLESYKKAKEELIENAFNNYERFFLLRRLETEIKPSYIGKYFADIDVAGLTNNEYNCIDVYRREIYLATYNEEKRKVIRGVKIGYVGALSTEQTYAGQSYLDVTNIIFEEFMARTPYLPNEPDKLMNFYSTIDRKRHKVRLWLVGNTISRVCPYLTDWGLMGIIKKQKQGDIATINVPTGEYYEDGTPEEVKIAIEYCKSTGVSSGVIGKHAKMLNSGSWQSDPQPILPKSYKDYKLLYRIGFQFKEFKFLGEYLKDKETKENVWFIYPYNDEFKENLIVISDIIKPSRYYQRNIYDITIKNDKIKMILDTFRESNIFYATDLVGTDFKQCIDFSIRK